MVLATPNGAKPHIDEASASAQHFEGDEGAFRRAEEFYLSHPSMNPRAREFRDALMAGEEARAAALAKGWPYAGYKMTIFSNSEEKWVENDVLHAEMCFHVVDALQIAGGEVITTAVDFEPHVVEDRELITGQNPRSDHLISKKLIEALERAAVLA